jgi:nitroreductase
MSGLQADFSALVRGARSCRRFDAARPIPAAVLRDLVDLARLCPCGGNAQPLRYRLVSAPDEVAAVGARCRWAAALKD